MEDNDNVIIKFPLNGMYLSTNKREKYNNLTAVSVPDKSIFYQTPLKIYKKYDKNTYKIKLKGYDLFLGATRVTMENDIYSAPALVPKNYASKIVISNNGISFRGGNLPDDDNYYLLSNEKGTSGVGFSKNNDIRRQSGIAKIISGKIKERTWLKLDPKLCNGQIMGSCNIGEISMFKQLNKDVCDLDRAHESNKYICFRYIKVKTNLRVYFVDTNNVEHTIMPAGNIVRKDFNVINIKNIDSDGEIKFNFEDMKFHGYIQIINNTMNKCGEYRLHFNKDKTGLYKINCRDNKYKHDKKTKQNKTSEKYFNIETINNKKLGVKKSPDEGYKLVYFKGAAKEENRFQINKNKLCTFYFEHCFKISGCENIDNTMLNGGKKIVYFDDDKHELRCVDYLENIPQNKIPNAVLKNTN